MESVSELSDHYCAQIEVCDAVMVISGPAMHMGANNIDAVHPTHQNDAESLQCGVDWTRAFKTHEDPLYRSFVHWQVRLLREQGKIASCTRPVIYDVEKAAPCPPHERLNEEQPATYEYVAIRQEVIIAPDAAELPRWLLGVLDCERTADRQGAERLYVVSMCPAHALSPLYLQTRCTIQPDAKLAVFVVLGRCGGDGDHPTMQPWLAVCSKRVALHMAHQGFTIAGVDRVTDSDENKVPAPAPANKRPRGDDGGDDDFRPLNFGSNTSTTTSEEKEIKTVAKTAPRAIKKTRGGLMQLAEMRGRDMAGLQVRCTIAGQLRSTVPVEIQLLVRSPLEHLKPPWPYPLHFSERPQGQSRLFPRQCRGRGC